MKHSDDKGAEIDKVQHLDLPGTLYHDVAAVRVPVGYGKQTRPHVQDLPVHVVACVCVLGRVGYVG